MGKNAKTYLYSHPASLYLLYDLAILLDMFMDSCGQESDTIWGISAIKLLIRLD